jgi:hypothetical protein
MGNDKISFIIELHAAVRPAANAPSDDDGEGVAQPVACLTSRAGF